ncbi:MAG: response regulator [Anaerolineae bacterium]|nr:response regulator [Anaerolineae bacterium]
MPPQEYQAEGDVLILIVAKPGRIRNSLQALLQIIPRLKVAGIASHTFLALQMLSQYQPALVLLDVDLPDNQAWVLLQEIQRKQPQTRCLLFVNSIEQQRAARVVGADAALLKGFETMELFTTIEKLLPPCNP